MNRLVTCQVMRFVAVIEQTGIPALQMVFSVGLLGFLCAGVLIFRKRHQFFDRDPSVANDVPVVRHNREEVILSVWTALTLVLLYLLFQVWST
jgi:hypothetical protein